MLKSWIDYVEIFGTSHMRKSTSSASFSKYPELLSNNILAQVRAKLALVLSNGQSSQVCLTQVTTKRQPKWQEKQSDCLHLALSMQPSPDAAMLAPGDGSQQTSNKDYIQSDNLQVISRSSNELRS